jgi:hypothetical protein
MPPFTMRDFDRIARVSDIRVIKCSSDSCAFLFKSKRIIILDDRLTGADLCRTARKLLGHCFGSLALLFVALLEVADYLW